MKNSIERICIAETEAEQIIKEANDLAADILTKASEAAVSIVSQTEDIAREATINELNLVYMANEIEIEKNNASALKEINVVNKKARAVQKDAVQEVIKALI